MNNYFLILYKNKKTNAYSFCYNECVDEIVLRNYWEVNEQNYRICNLKKIPDNKVEDFKKFVSKKKSLRFNYTQKNGNLFLDKFNVNFWA